MPRGIPTKAKNNPVFKSAPLASEHEIGQGQTRALDSDNLASFAPSPIARVSDHGVNTEKMQMLAFMNEDVTIRIATSTDRNAEQVFELNINGKPEFFRRGETKTVKRYFVDRLLRLKTTVYAQELVLNKEGIKSYIYPPSTGLKYDFAVVRDTNPSGDSWQRAVLAENG